MRNLKQQLQQITPKRITGATNLINPSFELLILENRTLRHSGESDWPSPACVHLSACHFRTLMID